MFDKLIKPVSDIVGKFVKDKDLQAQLDNELKTLFHEANLAQVEINKLEIINADFFKNFNLSIL